MANLDRWLIVVTGTEFIEDVRKAPEDELSFISATNEASSLDTSSLQFLLSNHSFSS